MNKPMTPSAETEMTDGQIDKVVDVFRAGLRKHRGEFQAGPVQEALGGPDTSKKIVAAFRECVERFSNMITRVVEIVQDRTPEQALTATGRNQYTDKKVVATMPRGTGKGPKKVTFFKIGRVVTDEELEAEFASRNLKPTDPFTLAAINEADPAFADEHPNSIHWKDAGGNWCYEAFGRWRGERNVHVHRNDGRWLDCWRFAGEQVEPQD